MDVHIYFGIYATICFVAVVWGITRVWTKQIEAKVCTSQLEHAGRVLEFQRKQHQDMVFFRREQMERMANFPFNGMGPRTRNDDPDQSH